jgi:hypothetical protein
MQYADMERANMRGANMVRANMERANMERANMVRANMERAYMRGANMERANMRGANMRGANMERAYMRGANITNTKLWDTIGNGKEIKTIQTEKYTINLTKDIIQIGCENHTIDEWFKFTDQEISAMDFGALEWWNKWKGVISSHIELF